MGREEEDEEVDSRPRRKRKSEGMSTGLKVLIGLLIAGGVSVIACCGIGFYVASNMFKITEDPQEIAKIQAEIADVTVPADLPPQMGMRMNMMGAFNMQMTVYGTEGDKTVMMMQMNASGASPAELDQQLQQQGDQQAAEHNRHVDIEETEMKTVVVNGEEREFAFSKGTDDNGNAVRQVSGTFPSRSGAGLLIMNVPEDKWNEEEALQMIQSIKK